MIMRSHTKAVPGYSSLFEESAIRTGTEDIWGGKRFLGAVDQ
jgi:hypothetical protein